MNRALSYGALIAYAAVAVILIASRPAWVSDENRFLHDFVNHEFLNLLGVILAITLASVANIHLEFNKIEERFNRGGLNKSRDNLRKNANWLIGLFMVGVVIVIVKPLISHEMAGAAFSNLAAIFILLCHVLILVSLTRLVFAIPPNLKPDANPAPQPPPDTEA